MAAVWRLTGATRTDRTAVGIAIVEVVARHPLCNELSTEIYIFPTAHRHGPLVQRLFVWDNRDMGVIWIGTGTVSDANRSSQWCVCNARLGFLWSVKN